MGGPGTAHRRHTQSCGAMRVGQGHGSWSTRLGSGRPSRVGRGSEVPKANGESQRYSPSLSAGATGAGAWPSHRVPSLGLLVVPLQLHRCSSSSDKCKSVLRGGGSKDLRPRTDAPHSPDSCRGSAGSRVRDGPALQVTGHRRRPSPPQPSEICACVLLCAQRLYLAEGATIARVQWANPAETLGILHLRGTSRVYHPGLAEGAADSACATCHLTPPDYVSRPVVENPYYVRML